METDTKFLREELEQFRKEKEEVRAIIGQIGGIESAKRHHAINIQTFPARFRGHFSCFLDLGSCSLRQRGRKPVAVGNIPYPPLSHQLLSRQPVDIRTCIAYRSGHMSTMK